MSPDSSAVTQVWQTPVRQAHLVGTSQASARSSTERVPSPNGAVMPLRAKVTSGPVPGGPGVVQHGQHGCDADAGRDEQDRAGAVVEDEVAAGSGHVQQRAG